MSPLYGVGNCCCSCNCSNCLNSAPCCWIAELPHYFGDVKIYLRQAYDGACTWIFISQHYYGINTATLTINQTSIELLIESTYGDIVYKKDFDNGIECCINEKGAYTLEYYQTDTNPNYEYLNLTTVKIFGSCIKNCKYKLCMEAVISGLNGDNDCNCAGCNELNRKFKMPQLGYTTYTFSTGIKPRKCKYNVVDGSVDIVNSTQCIINFKMDDTTLFPLNPDVPENQFRITWKETFTKSDEDIPWETFLLSQSFILPFYNNEDALQCSFGCNNVESSIVTVNFINTANNPETCISDEPQDLEQFGDACAVCLNGRSIAVDISINGESSTAVFTFNYTNTYPQQIEIYSGVDLIIKPDGGTEELPYQSVDLGNFWYWIPEYNPICEYENGTILERHEPYALNFSVSRDWNYTQCGFVLSAYESRIHKYQYVCHATIYFYQNNMQVGRCSLDPKTQEIWEGTCVGFKTNDSRIVYGGYWYQLPYSVIKYPFYNSGFIPVWTYPCLECMLPYGGMREYYSTILTCSKGFGEDGGDISNDDETINAGWNIL